MVAPYLPSRWLITTPDTVDDPNIFPLLPGQMFTTQKSEIWSSRVSTATSGRERRGAIWSYPKWQFKVGYEVLRDTPAELELQKLLAFFGMRRGKFGEFYYFDPSDNFVPNQTFGTGDGTTATFQLTRTIAVGAISLTEPVLGVQGLPTITVAGSPVSGFTIDTYGRVTFASPPANGAALAWTGTMMFRCRFDQDQLDVEQMMQRLWSSHGVSFVTVRPR